MRDVGYAARTLWRARGWTAVVVGSLALGIGANTALFSAVDGLLLRKLSVRDPDSIVRIRAAGPNHVRTDVLTYGHTRPDAQGRDIGSTFSYPMYLEFAAANRTLSDLFACAPIGTVNVVAGGRAEIASALLSSGNFYRALGITADVGRTIVPDDDRPAAAPVAVISRKYWASRFGSDPAIVGRQIRVNNAPVTIVGVLPRGFTGINRVVDEPPDVALPMALQPQIMLQPSILQSSLLNAPNFWWVEVMGRLKPGATASQVRDNLAAPFAETARAGFTSFLSSLSAEWRSRLTPKDLQTPELLVDSGSRGMYDPVVSDLRTVTVLGAVVALVLLIVCANVATLLLSRAEARLKELSVRMALGATRVRLVRQLLVESLLLAALGGALGLLTAYWAGGLLLAADVGATRVDWRVFAFCGGLSATAALIFGVVPALRATKDVVPGLKQSGIGTTRSNRLLGRSFVVAQVAISLVVLVAAGLLSRTVWNLRRADVGFNPRNLVLFRLSPALNRYDAGRIGQLYPRVADRLEKVAGVRSVAWSNNSLMSGRTFGTQIFIPGRNLRNGTGDRVSALSVSPAFFITMGIPIVEGVGSGRAIRRTRRPSPSSTKPPHDRCFQAVRRSVAG